MGTGRDGHTAQGWMSDAPVYPRCGPGGVRYIAADRIAKPWGAIPGSKGRPATAFSSHIAYAFSFSYPSDVHKMNMACTFYVHFFAYGNLAITKAGFFFRMHGSRLHMLPTILGLSELLTST